MNYLPLFLGSGGIIGLIVMFFWAGKWFGKIDSRLDSIDKRFDGIDKKFDGIDKRFNTLETSIDKRFDAIDKRFQVYDKKFEDILCEIREVNNRCSNIEKDVAIIRTVLVMKDILPRELLGVGEK